jgi:hypothetical protein
MERNISEEDEPTDWIKFECDSRQRLKLSAGSVALIVAAADEFFFFRNCRVGRFIHMPRGEAVNLAGGS